MLAAAAAGTQVVLAAMLAARPEPSPGGLSGWGLQNYRPEREVRMFLLGVAAALALAVATTLVRRRSRRLQSAAVAAGQLAAAAAGSGLFLILYLNTLDAAAAGEVPGRFWGATAALVTACLAAAAVGGHPPEGGESRTGAGEENGEPRLRLSLWDPVVAGVLAVLLYVPSWRQIAGSIFLQDSLLLHWDYFALAPALAFRHGIPLGAELFPNYGAGWPVVFGALSELVPLSFGRMIQVGSAYTVLYLSGVYLLLRVLVGRPWLAAAGTGLAVLPFFFWTHGLFLWLAPAVTPMRNPFDVWCLLALALHNRTGRRGWAAAAGALAGLEVVFHVQAGLVLVAAVLLYWIAVKAAGRSADGAGASLAVLVATVLAGALLAGRGQAFSGGFWRSWLDEPLDFLTVPLTSAPATTIAAFAALVLFYLAVTGDTIRRIAGGRAGSLDLLNGTVAFYGLLMLVKFAHYSTNTILPRMVTPAAIAAAVQAHRLLSASERTGSLRPAAARLVVAAGGLAVVALAVTTSGTGLAESLRSYPNVFSPATERGGFCLLEEPEDLCGLPEGIEPAAAQFRDAAQALRQVAREGGRAAVVDETGSLLYLASDTPPFGPTTRAFTSTWTVEQIERAAADLAEGRPDAVLTRRPLSATDDRALAYFGAGPVPESPYRDTWEALLEVVRAGYRLERTIGPWELWLRAGTEP